MDDVYCLEDECLRAKETNDEIEERMQAESGSFSFS